MTNSLQTAFTHLLIIRLCCTPLIVESDMSSVWSAWRRRYQESISVTADFHCGVAIEGNVELSREELLPIKSWVDHMAANWTPVSMGLEIPF
jgi:hypothetical protein